MCIYIYIYIWLVVWNMNFIFPNSWDDDPIWRTHIFQRDSNHQPGLILDSPIIDSPIDSLEYLYIYNL